MSRVLSIATSLALISASGSLAATARASSADADAAAWTVAMPNTTQPVTTPSGGTLAVSCYSSSSHLSPLVDLRKNGTRIWSQTPSAGTDPCPHTAIADAAGNVYAVLSTSRRVRAAGLQSSRSGEMDGLAR